jgi:hypothetical protein
MFIGKWAEVEYSAETSMTYIILKDDDDYLVSYFDRNDGYSMVLVWRRCNRRLYKLRRQLYSK